MPERVVNEAQIWFDEVLWSVVAMFLMGSMARTFVSEEPFDCKKFFGELLFSTIGAVIMYSAGLMQGMTEIQIVGFGAMASLGGVRMFEWFMKIAKGVRKSGAFDAD